MPMPRVTELAGQRARHRDHGGPCSRRTRAIAAGPQSAVSDASSRYARRRPLRAAATAWRVISQVPPDAHAHHAVPELDIDLLDAACRRAAWRGRLLRDRAPRLPCWRDRRGEALDRIRLGNVDVLVADGGAGRRNLGAGGAPAELAQHVAEHEARTVARARRRRSRGRPRGRRLATTIVRPSSMRSALVAIRGQQRVGHSRRATSPSARAASSRSTNSRAFALGDPAQANDAEVVLVQELLSSARRG